MALESGTRFGSYEVVGAIGAGGMGEVYRAHDTTLERDVAIKVLPESFASDASRVARFEQEAKILAALNHPNIAQIHGLEKTGGTTALIMELVDGATLEERIAKGPIPADEALGIAMQIADALEAAHGQNIVHRDLKPANIKLKHDGTVKVLDFGIAKALEPESLTSEPQSPIMTTPATQVGVILGTAAYMSPEQAKGKAIDQRTDIWAFGCVLYEMLTGQLAFGAEDVPTTLARIIANDTNLDSLPAAASPAVRKTVELCLQKDVRNRVRDIGDVRLALAGAFESTPKDAVAATIPSTPWWRRALSPALAAAIAVGGTAMYFGSAMRPQSPVINRFGDDLPVDQTFRFLGRPVIALAPDGRSFVYNTSDGFYLRTMDELEARVIPGTEGDSRAAAYSPDGQSLVFWDGVSRELKRISISGGAAVVIGPMAFNVNGLSWEADGTILIGQPNGIFRVAENGGTPERIVPIEEPDWVYGPRLLPDGDSLLFSIGPYGDADAARIVVQSLSTGERTMLIPGGNDARYLDTGHLVYAFGDGLFAVAFDLEQLRITSAPVPVVQGVMRTTGGITGAANYDVSHDGTLVYVSGDASSNTRTVAWVDRDGVQQTIDLEQRQYDYVQLSPNGERIALSAFNEPADVWIWDTARETLSRLTFEPGPNRAPIWFPDGQRVAFSQSVDGIQEIFTQPADGSSAAVALTQGSPGSVLPNDISLDQAILLYTLLPEENADAAADIWMAPLDNAPTTGTPLIAGPFDERSARLSPDGRWLAYQSDESGRTEVYVRPFPDVAATRWQISADGGSAPLWSRDGTELYFFVETIGPGDRVMAVRIEPGPTFRVSRPRVMIESDFPAPARDGPFYDVSSDGQRFLMIRNPTGRIAGEQPQFIIVQNWLDELERLVPTQ